MKFFNLLIDYLSEIDPTSYLEIFMIEKSGKVIYFKVLKALYRMMVVILLWHKKLKIDLEVIGFVFNPYYPCVKKRKKLTSQHIIGFHLDDILSTNLNTKINEECISGPIKCMRN